MPEFEMKTVSVELEKLINYYINTLEISNGYGRPPCDLFNGEEIDFGISFYIYCDDFIRLEIFQNSLFREAMLSDNISLQDEVKKLLNNIYIDTHHGDTTIWFKNYNINTELNWRFK